MDLRTLVYAFVVLQVCCAVALMVMDRSISGLSGLRWFASAYVTSTVAMIIGLRLLETPHPLMLVSWVARVLMLLGGVLVIQGAAEYVAPAANALRWGLGLLAAYALVVIYPLAVPRYADVSVTLSAGIYGVELVFAALLLLSHSEPGERFPCAMAAAFLGLTGLLALIRAVLVPTHLVTGDPFGSSALRFYGFSFFFVASLGMAFSFVWMAIARLRNQLERQARTDDLTGVLNRRAVGGLGLQTLSDCAARHAPVAVLAIDLDHFKRLNDTYGHAGGDAVLAATAHLLNQGLRAGDLVARFGGEEFIAVLPDRDGRRGFQIAERLRKRFEALTVEHGGRTMRVTASFGVAAWSPTAAEDIDAVTRAWDDLLLRADQMLYRAKEEGRNCTRGDWVPTPAPGVEVGANAIPAVTGGDAATAAGAAH